MVEWVKDHKLYHVTVAAPHKKAFVADQSFHAGDEYNPFFDFYERARTYPVRENGSIIQVNAITWLRRVKEGTIAATSMNVLADTALEVAQHYVMLCRELLMEEIRRDAFGSKPPSRQRCLYGCGTLDEARYWKGRMGGSGTIVELTCTGTTHCADARMLLGDSEPLSVTKKRARQYWRGDKAPERSEMETLFCGDGKVTAFGL